MTRAAFAGHDAASVATARQEQASTSGIPAASIFATWLTAEQPQDWPILYWLVTWAMPELIAALRVVAPHTETEALRCA